MNQDKTPIWERQGRPKPPRTASGDAVIYMRRWCRAHVYRISGMNHWWVEVGYVCRPFRTFAEAVAYADREARR